MADVCRQHSECPHQLANSHLQELSVGGVGRHIVDSTVVGTDNAGDEGVSTVLYGLVSVSDGTMMSGRLTVVSTLVARDSNKELLVSVVSPEVEDPRKGSPEFVMSSGDDTASGTYIEQTELTYCSNGIGNC